MSKMKYKELRQELREYYSKTSYENAKKYLKWEEFLLASISKTYTKARIQRTCMFILLQITKAQMQENNRFNQVIVAGFDSIGQAFLKDKQVVTKFKSFLNSFKKLNSNVNIYLLTHFKLER